MQQNSTIMNTCQFDYRKSLSSASQTAFKDTGLLKRFSWLAFFFLLVLFVNFLFGSMHLNKLS